ncbi:MAG: UTRA domain-containing protein [Alphaproteobacteria bacterium]|nr:UTRA domain-containing protein [Alphaproteobacteria bacterium]
MAARISGVAEPRRPTPRTPGEAPIGGLDGEGPTWLQIRRALARPIVSGQWPPGTKLPAEIELARHFGASRMTVNKAIQNLVAQRLVRRTPKVGTIVAQCPQERPVFEIWDIADLVEQMGGGYSFRLLEREPASAAAQLEEIGVAPRTAVLWIRCLHLSHGKPFQLEERLVNVEAAPGILRQKLDKSGPGAWLLAHVPWTDAQHRITAQAAPKSIAKLLGVPPGTACLVVERRTWNRSTPVTLARLWHAGSQHSLVGHFSPGH